MEYVALLRGINVGTSKRLSMQDLKAVFVKMGFKNISTYINSGNVIFESSENENNIKENIVLHLKKEFGYDIQTLVKTKKELQKIADKIPSE